MTTGLPNLSGQEDVYSAHTTEHAPQRSLTQVEVVVLLERFPGALARLFALLCLFGLVPVSMQCTQCAEDEQRLQLCFDQIQPDRLNLLLRKISQLTECLDVRIGDSGVARFHHTAAREGDYSGSVGTGKSQLSQLS